MWNFIDSLRHKSPAIRRGYALGISLVIVLIIASLWIVDFSHSLLQTKQNVATSTDQTSLNSFTENISSGFEKVKSDISHSNPFSTSSPSKQTQTSNTQNAATVDFNHVIITDPGQ